MKVGLVCSRVRVEEKLLRDALAHRGADVELVDDRALALRLQRPEPRWDVVVVRSVSQTRALAVLRVFEMWGLPTVNTATVVERCNDKLATSCALAAASVPQPGTAVAFDPDTALQVAQDMGFPVVLKPLAGSWGRLLARLNDRDAAEAVFEDRVVLGSPEHSVFYLQEHVRKPGRDIRAFVVDGDVVCAVYRHSAHWITNTARGASTSNCVVGDDLRRLCRRAAAAAGGGALAVDVLEDGDRLLVSEVNATMEFRNSIDVTGVDIPGRLADFVLTQARHRVPVEATA